MSIIPRARTDVQTELVGINARNETRVSYAAADAIGQATRGITEGLGAVAELAEKQSIRADMSSYVEAQRKLSDWNNRWNDPNNPKGVNSFQGRDALKLPDVMLPDFDQEATRIEAGLPSKRAKEKFREMAAVERGQVFASVSRYATAQLGGWEAANREATAQQSSNDTANAVLSGQYDRAAQLHALALQTISEDGALRGRPQAETTVRLAQFESKTHERVMESLIVSDPLAARDYFEQNSVDMLPDTRNRLAGNLYQNLRQVQGEIDGDAAVNGDPLPDDATTPPPRGEPSPQVRAAIDQAAKKYGVPPEYLYAIAEQESGFNPSAVNKERLDDGDRAAGLFQFRGSTANDLGGFNRLDARESADAAARQFADRSTQHGPTFAIAAHFAGDAGAEAVVKRGRKDENPKTAHYVGEVSARARRWGAPEANGRENSPTFLPPAASEAEALDRVDAIPDPRRQQAAAARVRDVYGRRRMEADERKRTKGEQLNLAIETADPNADIRTVLGPDFAYAASQGWVPGLQQRLRQRRTGDQPQSDPNVLYALQEGVYRAALGHEAAKAGLSAINPYDPTLPLALEDRARLADQQRALLTGDKKAVSKVVTEAEFNGVVKRYQQTLDVSPSSEKGVAFSDAMRTWRDRFTEANGVEPTFTETRKQADQLTLKAAVVGSDWRGKRDPSRDEKVPVVEVTRSDQIPVRYRKEIALELVRRGVPYSDAAAVRLYVGAVQAGEIRVKE